MLRGSAGKFFQSLHVPDWTLLYFKLQYKIPDQGWQMLLCTFKLGRTSVSFNFDVFILMREFVMHTYQSILAKCSAPPHLGYKLKENGIKFLSLHRNLDLSSFK